MSEKIIGYLLIATGVIIIIVSGLSATRAVKTQKIPVTFFSEQTINSFSGKSVTPKETMPINIQEMLGISPTMIGTILNITVYLVILGFFVKLGFHLASLGTMLVRPIVVDLKTQKDKTVDK